MGWAAEFDQQFFKGHRTKRKLSARERRGNEEGEGEIEEGRRPARQGERERGRDNGAGGVEGRGREEILHEEKAEGNGGVR